MAAETKFSGKALVLLRKLQVGDDIAEPNIYPHSHAFNDHAIAYLNNAVALCRASGGIDFRVFAAFYAVRHGVELWLKCTVQNVLIDEALETIFTCKEADLGNIVGSLKLERNQAKGLVKALCVMHNVMHDNLVYPECQSANITAEHANEAIQFIRENGREPRSRFHWLPLVATHDLIGLWENAKARVASVRLRVVEHASYVGLGEPLPVDDIEATCQLFGTLDPSGDGFRYPSSFYGEWYLHLPHVSMERLADLAQSLENTVRAYDCLLEEAYSLANLRTPWPF